MSRRHWVEDEYEYSRPQRYSNVSSNVYVTPQRYMTTHTESYSPVGKTYVRTIPNVAHQRLTTTSYPPRSYTPHHYDEERVLGYRVPPSSHAITTTSYRPWMEEEPMMEYMPYQPPPRHIDYRPSYADTWKTAISPSTRARWHTDEDEDYYVDEEVDPEVYVPPRSRRHRQAAPAKMGPQITDYPGYYEERYNDMLSTNRPLAKRDHMMSSYCPAVSAPHYSYADKYASDLEDAMESSGAIVPGNYFAARHTEPTSSVMLRKPIPKPRGPYEDLADEYPAHGRKYVVVPMRNVYSNIYNMSYYRKPMQQANIGRGHLACVRFIGSKAIHPLRPEKTYDITKIPREVASLSLYGNMIAAVRDHRLVRVSIHPIQWKDDEGSPKKKSRILDISVDAIPPRKWRFMGGDGGIGTISSSDKITEITDTKPQPKVQAKVERKPDPKPAPRKQPSPEPIPPPKKEPTPEPIPPPKKEPTPEPPKEEPKPEPETEKKKKKISKGSAAEPEKKPEEAKPEPPKEEPKPEPPKEEPKPEPPKEEPKPEPPKEEPKPEPPKEESKPEPPKEEPKPEPPKEEPEPPKEEPQPEPPKEEALPEPVQEEVKSEPPVLEAEPPKEEPQPEPLKEEPEPPKETAEPELAAEESQPEPQVAAEPAQEEIPKEDSVPEPAAPALEETAVPTEPAPEVPESEAPKEDSAPEQTEAVPEPVAEEPAAAAPEPDLAAEAEDTLTDEAAAEAALVAKQAARRASAFDQDPSWLEGLSEGGGGSA